MAETVSLRPDDSAISSCFGPSGERENAPSLEEGRGVSKPRRNNELKEGFCPENRNLFPSENQLEQKEDSEGIFEWKTERDKLEKGKGDAHNSPASVTCPGSRRRHESAQVMTHHDKNVRTRTHFFQGDNTAVNIDLAQMQVIKARQEMESSPKDEMDAGHLHSALHLIVKEHGAEKRESFVENNDSTDWKDESAMPREDTNESKHIGQYVFLTCWFSFIKTMMVE